MRAAFIVLAGVTALAGTILVFRPDAGNLSIPSLAGTILDCPAERRDWTSSCITTGGRGHPASRRLAPCR